ncbi:MAG TPA: Ig-like domain-containing protein [Gemmatimonadaceae bacterium]|nr:Ig-like domain-containing protein [Gemmatimonadaceae bacterium]
MMAKSFRSSFRRARSIALRAILGSTAGVAAFSACSETSGPNTISVPTGVSAVFVAPTSARVTWTANPASEEVVSYNIYRNGVKVSEATASPFVDTNLEEQKTYSYSVSANGPDGAVSERSAEGAGATVAVPDQTAPRVLDNLPAAGATVPTSTSPITATFSESVDPATVNASSFTVRVTATGAQIAGAVTYNATTRAAEFRPSSALPPSTGFTVTITTAIRDAAANALQSAHTWNFSTRDEVAPTVVSVSPTAGASSVPVNSAVQVTFSEAMDATSITSSTITLSGPGGSIAGSVSYNAASRVATFTPSAALANSASYTVTVTTGVKDAAGNALAAPFAASFTTAAVVDATAPTVITPISPANAATGIALATAVTAVFSEPMDPATISSTTVTLRATTSGAAVSGSVAYNSAARTVTFTPSSPLAAGTNYTFSITTGARDLAGNALATAFSSTFTTVAPSDVTAPTVVSTNPASGAGGVGVSSTVSVTFSETMDPATISSSTITLAPSGGSAVAATVSYNAGSNTATLIPSSPLSNSTTYTLTVTTGVKDAAGNSLASAFTTSFSTAAAVDTTPPVVATVTPANGAGGIAVSTTVIAGFNEPMDPATINTSTVGLRTTSSGAVVSGAVTYDASARTVTFTPSSPLAAGTDYTFAITTGARDVTGNALASAFASTFTTVAPSDVTAPTVIANLPANGATGVSPTIIVTATFSEPMDVSTINSNTFLLRNTSTGAQITGIVTWNPGTNTAGFNVQAPLSNNTQYTATITTGARDVAGNPVASEFTFSFVTAVPADVTAPSVSSMSPSSGSNGVSVNTSVTVTFSEPMDAATINTSTITLTPSGGSPVAASVSYNAGANTATLTPSAPLANATGYTLTVTTGAKDVAGNSLASNFSGSFTTTAPSDGVAPSVTGVNPANRAANVSSTSPVTITFSEAMNAGTLNTSTIQIASTATGEVVPGSVSYNAGNNTATFTPSEPYKNHFSYSVTVSTGAQDVAGNGLSSTFTSCFTPVSGGGAAISMTGFWSADDACREVHWHITLDQTGNTISLRSSSAGTANSRVTALNETGQAILGGTFVDVSSVTGTVSGTTITMTISIATGRTFNFVGSFSATGNGNPWITGVISGSTLPPVGITFERQGP